jgi:heterodisulfide reductase subunit A-like polyferredoxin
MSMSNNGKETPVGAVMVVGGGIAGIQASLDLADSDFKVYLVESKSAIGGHMAQLDKTFPTNDCAMCTISPKLVDTGRHRNIDLMTDTEVVRIDGQAGDFTVTVRHKPRYIDVSKCTGCGECADVCPVIIPSRFDEGLAIQRAAHKLYPQAVPNAYAIEKRGIAPCRDACPTGQRAQGYIALIREGRYDDALRVIKEDNPFPGICGRICNHRCEDACNRNLVDEPLNIHTLKRFVTDKVYAKPYEPPQRVERKYDKSIAVIGAGPCGLTAAKDLCKLGYPVTVFEALPVAGGMLRVGVPEYRLPTWIVDREVQEIVDLGVELRLNSPVTNLDDLFNQGFQSVLIAVGAHEGRKLPIPGTDLPEVLINTNFLRDVRLAERDTTIENPKSKIQNRHVLVLGGGNVAMDCARTAVRLGAAKVDMACLESREKMPAHIHEVHEAEEEGITIYNSHSFKRVLDKDGHVAGVEAVNVTFMEFDSEGRLNLQTQEGSEHVLECDVVIFAIGQRAGLAFLPASAGVGTTRGATVAVNPNTFAATRPGVFAAGDATSGTAFVVEAVAAGHKVAESIHKYLRGEELEPKVKPELPVVKLTKDEVNERMARGEVHVTPRVQMQALEAAERSRSFDEVNLGYTDEEAQAEAARCLACGVCSECLSCWYKCGVGAVDHDMVERIEQVKVGAVILAPGYEIYNAKLAQEYGLGRYSNVVTALQFERLLSASGPTLGHIKRPSDAQSPKKIAFLQCVGSRDQNHDYCSSVCCMYAAKEAIMAIEHARAEGHGDLECHVFFMDMRSFSKGYEEYYRRAEKKYGVKYHRTRISALKENPANGSLTLKYVDEHRQMITGDQRSIRKVKPTQLLVEEEFDLIVLSVGMEISDKVKQLGRDLGLELDDYGFCHTTFFDPLQSSRAGIYVAGPFREPKDIPESVVEASGAAAAAEKLLAASRGLLARQVAYPPERDITQEEPRVGVFVCHCGSNIGGYLDVPEVAEYARTLGGVVHAENNLYTCSQDTIKHIIETVKEQNLNRVVVSSCTPLTHEPLFQDAIRQAGLNPYLFEMANIRNQCSWVHSSDRAGATRKAKDLVRMAVARAAELRSLHTSQMPVSKLALVIGGGATGMTAALMLADQGFPVHLVERTGQLGGSLRSVHFLSDSSQKPETGFHSLDPQKYLRELIARIESHPLVTIHLETQLIETGGFQGAFESKIRTRRAGDRATGRQGEQETIIRHGATIVASGGQEYRGQEYGLGQNPHVMTQLDFEALLADKETRREGDKEIPAPYSLLPDSVAMIQCVGPAEKYCARTCCAVTLKNALKLKELNPDAQITVLFKDMRTYGFKERLYTEARRQGILFVRYDSEHKPQILDQSSSLSLEDRQPPTNDQNATRNTQHAITVQVFDPSLGRELTFNVDLLVLSNPIIPAAGAKELGTVLKVPVDMDGFFLEAHVKLRPVDFASDGIFMAGLAHYPKFLDESIIQAQAAAARAAIILSKDSITSSARVAAVDSSKCVGCLTCVRICPYDVPKIKPDFSGVGGITGAAFIEPAACHGCGSCAAECPAKAIQLLHYTDAQVLVKVDALFKQPAVVPIEAIEVKSHGVNN